MFFGPDGVIFCNVGIININDSDKKSANKQIKNKKVK